MLDVHVTDSRIYIVNMDTVVLYSCFRVASAELRDGGRNLSFTPNPVIRVIPAAA